MSQKDKQKWDAKFAKKPDLLKPREASDYLKKFLYSFDVNNALDLACGAGRNSIFLASKHNSMVTSVDIAQVAIDTLLNRAKDEKVLDKIEAINADLDYFEFKKDHYDLILMTNFLDRNLIDKTKSSLKKGGVYMVETYMDDPMNEKENSDPSYLLKKDELKRIFSDFEILIYDEFENESYEIYKMKKQVIFAKKI